MDCKFLTVEGLFNYRVAGVFVHEGRLLAMKDDGIDHYYLPGGRVKMHETTAEALCREVGEELYVGARPLRPLWLNEAFFENAGKRVHELALYWLAELEWEKLPSLAGSFDLTDTDGVTHHFTWLEPEQVRAAHIYPLVLKDQFPALPQSLTLVSDIQQRESPPTGT